MIYSELISPPRLVQAWEKFRCGKMKKPDVQTFARWLEDNLFTLHSELSRKTYRHSTYTSFWVHDPKQRHIHKAPVIDRVVHHLLYTYLYELFDPLFIYDSYACRNGKGTHKAVDRLENFVRKVSKNYSGSCWVLHGDIKQFFASVDHKILFSFLKRHIDDLDILWLLWQVIDSFHSDVGVGKGIPLGNLTSQIFANIYLNEFDQYMKHTQKVRFYIRYADDFVIVNSSKEVLLQFVEPMRDFLKTHLTLELHPGKLSFCKLAWGVDFLGYIVLPRYVLPRTKTKRWMLVHISEYLYSPRMSQMIQSYLGYLSHTDDYKLGVFIQLYAMNYS
jgi:RNA-directed DNA polymerase